MPSSSASWTPCMWRIKRSSRHEDEEAWDRIPILSSSAGRHDWNRIPPGITSMQVTDELIRSVVQEVLSHVRNGHAKPANGRVHRWGIFDDVDEAVAAAVDAQKQFEARGLEDRRKAVACIRKICVDRAEELGRDELEE